MPDFTAEREAMVERQLKRRGIADDHILDAFRSIPRESFVRPGDATSAYGDHPLPIGHGQTISQPFIVAMMIKAAELGPRQSVLEVGAGSGYAAAVISRIAGHVIAIERKPELVQYARERLHMLSCENVSVVQGDGSTGWPTGAPYDAILVAASGSHVPQPLVEQLADSGRLVMPVGDPGDVQDLIKVTKGPGSKLTRENLGPVRFVPLIGEEGWKDA